jgi:exonuclease III
MRITSWNVYGKNRDIENIIKFVKQSDADVICLQEISYDMLARLRKEFDWYFQATTDFFENNQEAFLVIMTRKPFTFSENNALSRNIKQTPYQRFMRWQEVMSFQQVEYVLEGKKYLIVNIHLSNGAAPKRRIDEMRYILKTINNRNPDSEIVLCGDMNTFGNPFLNFFIAPFFNYKTSEIFTNDVKEFTKLMKTNGFTDALPVATTQKLYFMNFKLDYIFLTNKSKVIKSDVIKDSFGSDHNPVYVEI